uniref:Uncharacterized protein n=1 Tax=Glossina pallidipes TaxID=7398 RepID=A0A1B0A5G5_GLOPL
MITKLFRKQSSLIDNPNCQDWTGELKSFANKTKELPKPTKIYVASKVTDNRGTMERVLRRSNLMADLMAVRHSLLSEFRHFLSFFMLIRLPPFHYNKRQKLIFSFDRLVIVVAVCLVVHCSLSLQLLLLNDFDKKLFASAKCNNTFAQQQRAYNIWTSSREITESPNHRITGYGDEENSNYAVVMLHQNFAKNRRMEIVFVQN